jgi:hypothetical protein
MQDQIKALQQKVKEKKRAIDKQRETNFEVNDQIKH